MSWAFLVFPLSAVLVNTKIPLNILLSIEMLSFTAVLFLLMSYSWNLNMNLLALMVVFVMEGSLGLTLFILLKTQNKTSMNKSTFLMW